jgi:DNA sulfur modification protein DndD
MTLNNKDNENNIILIGGVNGSGKTTILESIRLCMFGKRFNGSILSNKDYENYLISAKNKSSIRDNDKRFFIQIEVEIDNTFPTYSITLKRDWELSNNGKINKENFTIFRGGAPLEIIPEEYWEDYIISLFPPYISNHFFFDGERIKELAIGNNADEILRESIRDLTGLKLYEALTDDLSTLKSKIKRRNINRFEIQTEIREKEREILTIKNELIKIEKNIEEKIFNITELNNRKKDIEENLRRKADAFAEEREKNENTIFKLKEELNGLNNEINIFVRILFPLLLHQKLVKIC